MLILAMIKAVMQWMFPYDRPNCAKYPPVCYNQMLNLPMEQLEVYEHLKNGGMSIVGVSKHMCSFTFLFFHEF